jgi:hypothetical protein
VHLFLYSNPFHTCPLSWFSFPFFSLISSRFVAAVVGMSDAHYKHQHENLTGWAQMIFTISYIYREAVRQDIRTEYSDIKPELSTFRIRARACSCNNLPPGVTTVKTTVTPVQKAECVLWFNKIRSVQGHCRSSEWIHLLNNLFMHGTNSSVKQDVCIKGKVPLASLWVTIQRKEWVSPLLQVHRSQQRVHAVN